MKRRGAKDRTAASTSADATATTWFEVASALGRWRGTVTPRGLARLEFLGERAGGLPARPPSPPSSEPGHAPAGRRDDAHPVARELREYFSGRRRAFTSPVDLAGEPPFRRRVLEALCRVPFGATTTYGELARATGSPKAARAVGQAVGANPVPVVVPCHRVLAADGRIGGFGLGLDAKRKLLEIEGVGIAPR